MNVAFHTLAGLAISQTAAARRERRAVDGVPAAPGGGRRDLVTPLVVFVLAIFSHVVLDDLQHFYPFRAFGDTTTTALLFFGWMSMVPRRYWALYILGVAGAILPDVIDHVPEDLNRHLGLHLPVLPNLFTCHWREGTGSLSGPHPVRFHIVSVVNHIIVVSFCAAALWISRGVLRRPGSRA